MKKLLIMACVLCLALSVVICGCSNGDKLPATSGQVVFELDIPSFSDTSSPVIVTFAGSSDVSHAVTAADIKDKKALDMEAGTYTVTFISPINADASLYTVPNQQKVEVKAGETVTIKGVFSPIAASDVTPDLLATTLADIQTAMEHGDATLTGEVGASVAKLAADNAAAAPTISAEDIQVFKDGANAAVVAGSAKSTNDDAPNGSANGSTSASAASSPTPAASTPASSQPTQHSHNWVAMTETKTVVDQEGYTEDIAVFSDGYRAYTSADRRAYQEKTGLSYSCVSIYHAPVTHQETVTVGYRCECGATK